jgi:hypothetical protein
MTMTTVGHVIENMASYAPDMCVYVPEAEWEVTLLTPVKLVRHGDYGPDDVEGYRNLLPAGDMCEVVDGLRAQLGKEPTPSQALRAVLYYAEYDASPDPELLSEVIGP